jgi:hypothetical protein
MLNVLTIVREMRRHTSKLQHEVAALKVFLNSINPDVGAELKRIQAEGEKALAAQKPQKPSADDEFDKLLDEAIGIFGTDQRKMDN